MALWGGLYAVYQPALSGGFVWDDDAWTSGLTPLTRDLHGLWRIWTEPTTLQQYYPMTGTSFWLDQRLWGSWTLPYHVENVLFHALGAMLLWHLLARLAVPGAALTAAVFAVHPVMVESVAWITERKNVLSLAFMLGGLLCYGRFMGWWRSEPNDSAPNLKSRWYVAALCLCLLALFSKITAFVFGPTVLLLGWWRHGKLNWRHHIVPALPFFVVALALGGLVWWLETFHVGAEGKDFSMSLAERCISAGRAFWFYPWKLLWPVDLSFIYPDWRSQPITAWHWIWPGSVIGLLACLWGCVRFIGRGPLVAVLFYLGAMLPVSGLLNVYGAVFAPVWDHWVYVPSLGILVLAGAIMTLLARRVGRGWFQVTTAAVILSLLAWQARQQTGQYANKEELWEETIRRNPAAWLALNNHGSSLVDEGKLEEAVQHFTASAAANPRYAQAWNNLAGALVRQGKAEAALEPYRQAILLDSEIAPFVRLNLGNALLSLGHVDEAMEQFHASLAARPDYEEALNSLAAALIQKGRLDEAVERLQEAVRLKPDYYQAYNNLGSALQKKEDLEGALQAYAKAVEIKNDFMEANISLAEMRYRKGDLDGAIAQYKKIIGIKPDHVTAWFNLGLCLSEKEQIQEADAAYEKAIELDPGHAGAHNSLANNFLKEGRDSEALKHFQKAVDAEPGQVAALHNLAWLLATNMDPALRNGRQAVEMAERAVDLTRRGNPLVLSTLAAAYAEAGRFNEATSTAQQAKDLATSQGDTSLAASIESHAQSFANQRPLRSVSRAVK